uniref:tetratricopeptide repeat protein 39B isoform X2 n=1 Tax=Ciona intestinalis TaxID=7719 RepID=UPI000180C438|nr:tetratricopeptide repeat protein 39B isoform X2 [Ciona intestinalis]|eukprot:XP_009861400.1 tetratricopeptide repeat protein 39B isoform X2 [Ciona intestinalis]
MDSNTKPQEDSDDEFEDASSQISSGESIDLNVALAEVNVAINLFFNNRFDEAKKLMQERCETSMYHALGLSTLLFLEASLTFEQAAIAKAILSIKKAVQLNNRYRKKQNLTSSFTKILGFGDNNDFTDVELHAEVVFAELNLFRAALTFIQDENLISFIRGALKVRLCYQTYNNCQKLIDSKTLNCKNHAQDFIGAVLLGCGAFNIGLSLLPPKILSLLEWIGFTSDKKKGLQQLKDGFNNVNLRSSLISLFILGYNLFVTVHVGTHDADLEYVGIILPKMLEKFPNGVFFYLYAGRLEQLKGNFEKAIGRLEKAATLQNDWKQFSHACYWELMWCHATLFKWQEAADYADKLRKESNWSKCTYTYLQAVFLYMVDGNGLKHKEEIVALLKEMPSLKQRFAGKSIPMEKFLIRKARKYFEQQEYLLLPAHEMIYAWNGLVMLKQNKEIRDKHLQLIIQQQNVLEEKKEKFSSNSDNNSKNDKGDAFNYYDDYCLLNLMKGACLRFDRQPMQAELCLSDIKENYKGINKDHYLAPAALADLAWMCIEEGKFNEATAHLKYIRKTYSHYSMESRIHFRIHAAQTKLNEISKPSFST